MAEPMYSGDLFIDESYPLKSEPMAVDALLTTNNASASVPIPNRRQMDLSDLRDGFDFGDLSSPCSTSFQDNNFTMPSFYSGMSPWTLKSDVKMEDDDIFQVDKADLIQGPTLAELNANDGTLLEDLNFDDLVLPEESSYSIQVPPPAQRMSPIMPTQNVLLSGAPNSVAMSFPPDGAGFYKEFSLLRNASNPYETVQNEERVGFKPNLSPASHHSSNSSLIVQTNTSSLSPSTQGGLSPVPPKYTTLQDLLTKNSLSPEQQVLGQSVPGRSSMMPSVNVPKRSAHSPVFSSSRLCSSAPTHLGLEHIWQWREPRKHLLSTGSMAEATSTSSLSTGGVLSPEAHDFSLDECYDSDDDSDHYEDFSSDAESVASDAENPGKHKRERYFWQYNVQAKGPKGQRLIVKTSQEDPHCLNEVMDPVFSPECSLQGIKHSGKARKGDGNDLTPNPRKLQAIGKELDKLNRTINDMTPVSELPFNVRPKTRKEKNKLASRACRLKKKAQHEANKIKLQGLEYEHRRLMNGISQAKQLIIQKVTSETPEQVEISKQMDKIVAKASKLKIAGQTTEFVNKILDKVKQGVNNGGLDDLHTSSF